MISIAEKIVSGGSCLARIDGKAVFVPMALPGETLDIELTDNRKDFAFARVKAILEPSPRRIAPPCPYFGQCGGCTLQMADSAYQTELRQAILGDVLARAHVTPESVLAPIVGQPFEYRSRFQFHRAGKAGVGLREGKSDAVVCIGDCPVAVPEIRAALRDGSLAREARNRNAGDRFHIFAYDGRLWADYADTSCSVRIRDAAIAFDARGFFQSNVPMLGKMIDGVLSGLTGGERLLDFYSGVGTFSAFAGSAFRESVLVEHNREAVAQAEINLRDMPFRRTFCPVSDDAWPTHPASRLAYDCAIVDPPRQGLSKAACDWFALGRIPQLRYVSCDPVTFARDAARLVAAGYRLTSVTLYDFYPQTHHLETLGIFVK